MVRGGCFDYSEIHTPTCGSQHPRTGNDDPSRHHPVRLAGPIASRARASPGAAGFCSRIVPLSGTDGVENAGWTRHRCQWVSFRFLGRITWRARASSGAVVFCSRIVPLPGTDHVESACVVGRGGVLLTDRSASRDGSCRERVCRRARWCSAHGSFRFPGRVALRTLDDPSPISAGFVPLPGMDRVENACVVGRGGVLLMDRSVSRDGWR